MFDVYIVNNEYITFRDCGKDGVDGFAGLAQK